MEYKDISDSTKDVDTSGRKVVMVLSEMGSKDLDNDVIEQGAYNKTISERGPTGKNLIVHLRDHNPSITNGLIGKFSELYEKGNQLIGVDNIPDTNTGNDMLKMYQAGLINQHSVGFTSVQSENIKGKTPEESYRSIKQIKLYEGSAVLWGANPNTPTISMGKSMSKDIENVLIKFLERLILVTKEIKNGNYTDKTFMLLEIEQKQLEDFIESLKTTPTAPDASGPDNVSEAATRLNLLALTF